MYFGPLAIPVVLADLPPRREPPGAFQAVEEIVVPEPHVPGGEGRIGLHGEIPPQPVDAAIDLLPLFRGVAIAAVDPVADHAGVRLVQHVVGDHQRGNARAGHAARRRHRLVIAPAAVVGPLIVLPIACWQAPRSRG